MDIHGFKGDMYQTAVVAKYELYKYIRNKKFYVFVGLLALLLIIQTVLPYLLGDGLSKDPQELMGGYVSWVMILVIIGVTLFSSGAIVSEFEDRTALLMFTRPIKKESIFLGKFIASFLFTATLMLVYLLVAIVISFAVAGGIPDGTFTAIGLSLLFILGASGVAFMLSSFLKRGSTAAIMTFALLMLILPMIYGILMAFGIEPIYDLIYASTAIDASISGAVTQTIMIDGQPILINGREMKNFVPTASMAAVIMTVWCLVTGFLSYLKFKTREF